MSFSDALMNGNCHNLQGVHSYMNNGTAIGFNWNYLRAFLATAETGSLSAAARLLKTSQPTLGRHVASLEKEVGIPLFERLGTSLRLTESGRDLLTHARAMNEAALQFSLAASGESRTLKGTVSISVGELFGAYVMPRIVETLQEREPGIEIDLLASNQSSDLKAREADIAFRARFDPEPNLTAVQVCQLRSRLYGSREYLRRMRGVSPSDHCFLSFEDTASYSRSLIDLGLPLSQQNFSVRTDSHLVQWRMAKEGLGIVMALEAIGDLDENMEVVWPNLEPLVTSMHLVAHREVLRSRRVRYVYDYLQEEFASLEHSKD